MLVNMSNGFLELELCSSTCVVSRKLKFREEVQRNISDKRTCRCFSELHHDTTDSSDSSLKVTALTLLMEAMSEMIQDILVATDVTENAEGVVTITFPDALGLPPRKVVASHVHSSLVISNELHVMREKAYDVRAVENYV